MVWKSQRTHCAWCGEAWTKAHRCATPRTIAGGSGLVVDPPTGDEKALTDKLAFLFPDSLLARTRWMQSPNPLLGGERPAECWLAGRRAAVLQVLEIAGDGGLRVMADDQRADFTVTIRAAYALWPGDGVFVVRYSAVELGADGWLLVDREGVRHELRPYRIGMLNGRPR